MSEQNSKAKLSDFDKVDAFSDLDNLPKLAELAESIVSQYGKLYQYAKSLENEIAGYSGLFDADGGLDVSQMPTPDKMKENISMFKAAKRGYLEWKKSNPGLNIEEHQEECFAACVESINLYARVFAVCAIIKSAYHLTTDNQKAMQLVSSLDKIGLDSSFAECLDEYLQHNGFEPEESGLDMDPR